MIAGRLALAVCLVAPIAAQQITSNALRFEVTTVKVSKADAAPGGIKPAPGGQRYEARKAPLKLMISLMYKMPSQRISGGPGWIDTELYDVDGKADKAYSIDDLHVMFQNLLVDRFGLKFHLESKEGAVYGLVVDKGGLKMKVNESAQDFQFTMTGSPDGSVVGRRESMTHFAWWLSTSVLRNERPVIDQTGLAGFYDFKLLFAPELPPGVDPSRLPPGMMDRPSLFVALREQLGLRLEPQKGKVDTFVIDRVEKPSEN